MADQLEEARILAALAVINVSPEREIALSDGLAGTKRLVESLSKVDLGWAAPAAQFRAPAAPGQ